MQFTYKAAKANGEMYESHGEFADRYALYNFVRQAGDTVISFDEAKKKMTLDSVIALLPIGKNISLHEKIIFTRNLGSMLNSGLSLTRALSVLERQAKPKSTLQHIIISLNEHINRGKSLSQALSEYSNIFSSLLISMVRSGEESGTLSESLKVVSVQMEKSYLLKKKIKGAMMYPSIIFSIMIGIGILMLVYVVPSLTATFKELHVELPWTTQLIISTSDLLQNHYLILLSIFVALVVGITVGLKTATGKRWFSYVTLHMPIIATITKESNSAQTTRTLSSLLSAGVDVVHAMEITSEVTQNVFYREVLAHSTETIQKGLPISQVFIDNPKIFPVFVGEMASVGEETGKLAPMLLEVATYYEEEVEQKTKDMSTIIEPFLMVFIGAAVGFFAISMLMPTYSLVNAF
ncbi:MAG: hypothetical protein RLZZ347_518 [Candidatus Parcubacteria bacterium]|jgi:type IV pilus assembly protein PilC